MQNEGPVFGQSRHLRGHNTEHY